MPVSSISDMSANARKHLFESNQKSMPFLKKIREHVHSITNSNNTLSKSLGWIEKETNVSREYSFYLFGFILILYLSFGYGNDFLTDLVGVIYPCLCTIKMIESKTQISGGDTDWNVYWSVYGILRILDYFHTVLLFWLPVYYLTKCIFLVWMMTPGESGGSFVVYNRIIRPFFLKYVDPIYNVQNEQTSFSRGVSETERRR